jgi:DNA relaxase NicK
MSIIYLYNINNTKGVYMQYVHDYIERLMAQGKADPKIRGWSMQTIMTQVGDKFGENDLEMIEYHKSIARAYIMSKCGVTDDE